MRVRSSLIVVLALVGRAHAEGDALIDTLGPREIAVGEALRGGATGASAIGLNPAGLPLNRELVFQGGYGYRAADSSSVMALSACDSTNAAPGCFYYTRTGSDPELSGVVTERRTHVAGAAFGYPITPRVSLGSGIKYFSSKNDAMGSSDSSGWNWDLGLTLRITDMINVGTSAQNLWGADSAEFPRAAGGGVLVRPMQTLSVSFDARWKLDGDDRSARFGGGAELLVRTGSSAIPLRVGGLRDNGLGTTYVSAGIGYAHMKGAIDIAGRYAVSGEAGTMILASLRFYGPRFPDRGTELAD